MKVILDKYEKKPYGWPLVVLECLVAKLIAKGKLEASQGGESLVGVVAGGDAHEPHEQGDERQRDGDDHARDGVEHQDDGEGDLVGENYGGSE